jgi:predicted transcriptional regulator
MSEQLSTQSVSEHAVKMLGQLYLDMRPNPPSSLALITLLLLYTRGGESYSCSLTKLTAVVGTSSGNMTGVCKMLESQGLAKRIKREGMGKNLQLTTKGVVLVEQAVVKTRA